MVLIQQYSPYESLLIKSKWNVPVGNVARSGMRTSTLNHTRKEFPLEWPHLGCIERMMVNLNLVYGEKLSKGIMSLKQEHRHLNSKNKL